MSTIQKVLKIGVCESCDRTHPRCPYCNEPVCTISHGQTGTNWYQAYVDEEGYIAYDNSEFAAGDEGVWECPNWKCHKTLARSEEETLAFFKGEFDPRSIN